MLVACGDKAEDTSSTTEDTTTEDTATTDTSTTTDEPDLDNGKSVHDNRCMGCHASNNDIASHAPSMSDEELADIIQNGKGPMPAQNLSETDLRDVIAYIRQEYQ